MQPTAAQEYGGSSDNGVYNTTATLPFVTGLPDPTARFRDSNAQRAVQRFYTQSLQSVFGPQFYSGVQQVDGRIDFRGVPMLVVFPDTLPALDFSIPDIGFARTFGSRTGARDDSVDQLVELLKTDRALLGRLGRALVARSPADPLAGNPNSLQSLMIAGDFLAALSAVAPDFEPEDIAPLRTSSRPILLAQAGGSLPAVRGAVAAGNLAGAGLSANLLKFGALGANAFTVPLQYNVRSDIDPRRGFQVRLPVSVAAYEGADAASANLALSYRFPIDRRWVVTPSVGYGYTTSDDLAARGHLVSLSVASTYGWRLDNYDLVLANLAGYWRSLSMSGTYGYDPGLSNGAFRNGFMVSRPIDLGGARRAIQLHLVDTRVTGTELFVRNWQEIGVTFASRPRVNVARDYASAGIAYLYSSTFKGVTLQGSYLF
jgi:hypothetical protein